MVLIVLDINGVLGDVRKRSARKIRHRDADVVLPNGNLFYARKQVGEFLEQCYKLGNVMIWTSRKRVNAAPIERFLENKGYLKPETIKMHGEDCAMVVDFHPIKDVCVLRVKFPQFRKESIVFVDDSPNYIMADDRSKIIGVPTFNAEYDLYDTGAIIDLIVDKVKTKITI